MCGNKIIRTCEIHVNDHATHLPTLLLREFAPARSYAPARFMQSCKFLGPLRSSLKLPRRASHREAPGQKTPSARRKERHAGRNRRMKRGRVEKREGKQGIMGESQGGGKTKRRKGFKV